MLAEPKRTFALGDLVSGDSGNVEVGGSTLSGKDVLRSRRINTDKVAVCEERVSSFG